MGWQQGYYYKKERQGRRVVSIYVPISIAPYAAALDEHRQAERTASRAQDRAERQAERERIGIVGALLDTVRATLTAFLSSAGYHQHHRQWRKCRKRDAPMTVLDEVDHYRQTPESERGTFNALLTKLHAKKPAAADIAALLTFLQKHPTQARYVGDVARYAIDALLDYASKDTAARTCIEASLDQMKRELGYADSPALERLLIEAIAVSWLDYYENARRQSQTLAAGQCSLDKASYLNKSVGQAQGRYLRAIEMLARVRRLRLPDVLLLAMQQPAPAPPAALPAPTGEAVPVIEQCQRQNASTLT